jgi:hypothetical protein
VVERSPRIGSLHSTLIRLLEGVEGDEDAVREDVELLIELERLVGDPWVPALGGESVTEGRFVNLLRMLFMVTGMKKKLGSLFSMDGVQCVLTLQIVSRVYDFQLRLTETR